MADGFEIQVPITIKGGNEGEKVGKQIGEKIASQLNKSFKIAGISGGQKGTASPGISKGLSGIATKLGAVSLAVGAAVGLLAKASPYLKGILSIFGRAFMIFFRPFGDFLATLLRPLAILLLKLAVAWMKLTRPIVKAAKEGAEAAPQIKTTGTFVDPAIELANWALKLGGAIGGVIYEIGRAAFDLGGKIGQWLYDSVIKPAGDWIYAKLFGLWNWTKDFGNWLWEKIIGIWSWTHNFAEWLWGKITGIWEEGKEFNLKNWLITKITDWLNNSFLGSAFMKIFGKGSYQTGTPYVPGDGLYQLHKGEQVIPRNQAKSGNSIILKPTLNLNGNISQDLDVDSVARRASRIMEMELKSRGVL